MEVIWILFGGVYVYAVFVCLQKGKRVFGWLGLSAITVVLAPLVVWFPIVGALRPAKPGSQWERDHRSPQAPPLPPAGPAERFVTVGTAAPPPVASFSPPGRPGAVDEARIVSQFLARAVDSGVVAGSTRDRLLDFLHAPAGSAAPPAPAAPVSTAAAPPVREQAVEPQPVPATPPAPRPTPQPPAAPPVRPSQPVGAGAPPVPARPGPIVEWFKRAWDSVSAEIALHGFAYLGVLLTFVGVLGFLLFAFEDVDNSAQPFVELFVALIFFGWAWLLRRQQADNVANGMELLAGMILPLILFAGFVDGAPFPPNYTDGPLVAVLVAASLVMAVVYAFVARRRPTTMLRFLVVPHVWLGALAFGLAFKTDERLMGAAITRFVAVQPAFAAVAIAASVTPWARHRLAARSVPVVVPALVAAPVAYVLTVALSAGQSGLMAYAASLAGVATIVSAHQLAGHFNRPRPALLAMPILLGGAVIPVAPSAGLGWAGAAAVAGYVVLIEWMAQREQADRDGLLLAAAGLVVGLGLTFTEPLATVLTFGTMALWLHWRRVTGLPVAGADKLLVVAAAIAPLGLAWGLWTYAAPAVALITLAALSGAAALVARLGGSTDDFWDWWPAGTAAITGSLAAGIQVAQPAAIVVAGGAVIATVAFAAAAIALGRQWVEVRLWLSGALIVADVFFVLEALDASTAAAALTWASLGSLSVVVAALGRRPLWDHLATVGHVAGTAALLVPAGSGVAALVLSLWSLGWLVALFARHVDHGCLTRLLVRRAEEMPDDLEGISAVVEWTAPVLFAVSAPAALLTSLNLWNEFAAHRSWTGLTLAATAILYAAATQVRSSAAVLRRVLAIGAAAAIVLGAAIAAPDPWPTIGAAAASIAVAITLAADMRQVAVSWFAWVMSGVMVTLLAERLGVVPHRLYLVVLAWGAVLFAGGLVADDTIAGRRAVGEGLRVGWTRFPVFLGALVVPSSLGPNFAASSTIATWSAIGAAAAYGVVAWLLRSPLPTLPAYGLAAYGVVLLSDVAIRDEPMILVGIAAALVVAAVLTRLAAPSGSGGLWVAWDLPPLVVAHAVGVLALGVSAGNAEPAPWLAVAGLSAAVGVWRQRRRWFDAGHLIALVGAAFIGIGGLIVGLTLTTGRAMVELRRLDGAHRLVAHSVALAAASAAWVLLSVWSDWDLETAVTATALAAGGAALIVGTLGRIASIRGDTAVVWIGWSAIGAVAAAAGLAGDQIGGTAVGSHLATAFAVASLACAAQLLGPLLGRELQLAAAPVAGLAWLAIATSPGWDPATVIAGSSVGFGALGAVVAALVVASVIRGDAGVAWTGVATAGVGISALVAFASPDELATSGLRVAIAAGLVMLALAWQMFGRVFGDEVRLLAVLLTGLSWLVVASSPAWAAGSVAIVSAWLGGALATVAVEMRRRSKTVESPTVLLTSAWAMLGVLLVTAAALVAVDTEVSSLWASAAAPGTALLAVAAGRGAMALAAPGLRHVASLISLGSATCLVFGLGGRLEAIAAMAIMAAVLGVAVLVRMGPSSESSTVWLRPAELFTGLAFVEAAGLAAALLPDITAPAAVLLVAGLSAALLGVVRGSGWLMAAAPPLLAGGAMLLIAELATGSVQWYTLPLGLTVLAEVEIVGLMLLPEDRRAERDKLVLVEYAGIGLMVIPAIVELFVNSIAAGGVAFVVAVGLLLWGILTRVRRRAVAAAVVAVGAAVLMISAALAGNAPESAALWIIAAGLGFTVMSAAGVVEAARSSRGQAVRKIDELMGGWQ